MDLLPIGEEYETILPWP